MENITIEYKNKILYNIRNMPIDEFVARVNKLAHDTRYCNKTDDVCKLLTVCNSPVKVVRLDPDYFGSETDCMIIEDELDNDFKELFIQGMLSGWDYFSQDEKMDCINNFVY